MRLELSKNETMDGTKYDFNISNIVGFRIADSDFYFNFLYSHQTVKNKLLNIEIKPLVKLSLINHTLPVKLSYSYSKLEPSRTQVIDSYDYSKIINSLLPYEQNSFSISHSNQFIKNKNEIFLYKFKSTLSEIQNLERFLKLEANFKYIKNFNFNYFNINFQFDNSLKKCFKKSIIGKDETHILTGFEKHSQILGFEFKEEGEKNTVDNGENFLIKNCSTLRMENIKGLREISLIEYMCPYASLETFYFPNRNIKFFSIYSLGFSFRLNDQVFLDFKIKTDSNNPNLEKSVIDKFRIGIDFSLNL